MLPEFTALLFRVPYRAFGRERGAASWQRIHPLRQIFGPIPDQRSDFDEPRSAPLQPPSADRRKTDSDLLRHFLFSQKVLHASHLLTAFSRAARGRGEKGVVLVRRKVTSGAAVLNYQGNGTVTQGRPSRS